MSGPAATSNCALAFVSKSSFMKHLLGKMWSQYFKKIRVCNIINIVNEIQRDILEQYCICKFAYVTTICMQGFIYYILTDGTQWAMQM